MSDCPHQRIALFDMDHTLLPIDSDFTWTSFTNTKGLTRPEEVEQQNARFYADYREGRLDMRAYVHFVTRPLHGLSAQQLQAVQEQYVQEYIQPHILPPALELLQRHRQAGDITVLTTATNSFIAAGVGRRLGFADAHILATELQYTAEGAITGDIVGHSNLQAGKVRNFEQWLAAHGWRWDDVHITFYSDSVNDLPLLEKAHEPVATNPDVRLRQMARERNWRILDLFPTH